MYKSVIQYLFFFCLFNFGFQTAQAQFDPPAEKEGSEAIHADSSIFVDWASACTMERGLEDCADSTGKKASYGENSDAIGKADGLVVSLGDGGVATLTFDIPIANGQGADFAVFENSFSDTYLELAFVEVSSDGERFVRFPAVSNTDTTSQVGGFDNIEASKLYNLAGKYRAFYGTPFDLEELKDSVGLDVNKITHVRIVDVIGTLNDSFCSRDSKGNKVNDPYPTAFESGGFDLDAVGVIHNLDNYNSVKNIAKHSLVYPNPNPVNQEFTIQSSGNFNFRIFDLNGKVILKNFDFQKAHILKIEQSGVYFVNWEMQSGEKGSSKLIVR